ncbi:MAG TPA: hypothetical protein VG457_04165 [Planctomycetota bacterium]|jgi:hypothetical protein|nr:hypothetical protein [Planctomycetota bacterium]
MTEDLDTAHDSGLRLGSLALRSGMVSAQQLQSALATQAREAWEGKLPRQLGLMLLSEGMVNEAQLEFLLLQQQPLRRSGR